MPGDALHDGASHQRTDRHRGTRDARPHAQRDAAAFGGEGVGQQRERKRRDDRGAGALDGARGDQQVARRRQGGGGRGRGEHRRADQEHRLRPKRSPNAAPVNSSTAYEST